MLNLSSPARHQALRLATPYIAMSVKPVNSELFDARKWNQGIRGTGG